MECYFIVGKVCPVPDDIRNSGHCQACSSWEATKASMMLAQATVDMTRATVPKTGDETTKRTPPPKDDMAVG